MKYPPHEKPVIPIGTAGARIVTYLSTEPVSLHLHVTIGYQHIKAFWYIPLNESDLTFHAISKKNASYNAV
uniref:Uncharacterized protein n=1 Tax=Candidatus Methanophaga sp. ANME-1 ERB7 TaxID=2759913 RepID=A0A7G9Z4R6_9EURY|nr:hypothetical protein AJDLPONB_00004 [Methanosarcinales archaeon ANME-1 ERB7]